MKPLLIASLVFALAALAPAAVPLSPEAKADFQWFSSLGYPVLDEARWAEVWMGEGSRKGNGPVEYRTVPGFIVREEGDTFQVLTADLVLRELKAQFDPATPAGKVAYETRSFQTAAQQYLGTLRRFALTPAMWSIKDSKLGHRSQIFFMAYAAWQRGHTELAQELYDQAAHLPTRQGGKAPPEGLKFQDPLEQEMGRAAMWQAAGLFTSNGKPWPQSRSLPQRSEILAAFMQVVRRFPHSQEAPQAEKTAKLLEQMIAEDRSHPVISEEDLAKLPIEEQVSELIFRLRDQTAEQYSLPGSPDIFHPPSGVIQTPAHRLAAIGIPAVSQLMAALSDGRFTRASYSHGNLLLTKPTLTIGDCATLILERIAGRSLRPFRFGTIEESPTLIDTKLLNDWWQEAQAKGEEQSLVDALSAGHWPPRELAQVLKAKYPHALEPALIAGLRNSRNQDILSAFEREFRDINSTAVDGTLLEMLRHPTNPESKLVAIRILWDRQNPEALRAALAEFEKLCASHAGALSDPALGTHVRFLAGCGDSSAIRALHGRWDDLPSRTQHAVITQLPNMLATHNHERIQGGSVSSLVHRDESSREVALQLLISALGDSSPIIGMVAYGWPKSPRVCDVALSSLHKVEPEVFPFTPKAGAAQWDEEKVAGLRKWEERRTGKK